MANFFADNFSDCVAVAVLLMAMFPMLEGKAAIPFALSGAIWGKGVLSPLVAYLVVVAGSVLPAMLVIWLAKILKKHTSGFVHEKIFGKLKEKYNGQVLAVSTKNSAIKKCCALAAFVAIPLPLTGVYTGGLIGGLSNLKFWQASLSVCLGSAISSGIVLLFCVLFENATFYIFLASLALVGAWVLIEAALYLLKRLKKRKEM